MVGPRGGGKSTLIVLLKAVFDTVVGETTLADLCSNDPEMRRRTNAAVIDFNIVFVDECEVPDSLIKGEPAQQLETENMLQLSSCGSVAVRELGAKEDMFQS